MIAKTKCKRLMEFFKPNIVKNNQQQTVFISFSSEKNNSFFEHPT